MVRKIHFKQFTYKQYLNYRLKKRIKTIELTFSNFYVIKPSNTNQQDIDQFRQLIYKKNLNSIFIKRRLLKDSKFEKINIEGQTSILLLYNFDNLENFSVLTKLKQQISSKFGFDMLLSDNNIYSDKKLKTLDKLVPLNYQIQTLQILIYQFLKKNLARRI